jgi:rhamnosyltransferase subunit B
MEITSHCMIPPMHAIVKRLMTGVAPGQFLLTTFGSLGDLHPYIAVGIGLKERGHDVTIGSSAVYRPKVEGEGLKFRALRPEFEVGDPEVMRKAFHPRTGGHYILTKMVLPHLAAGYEDTLAAAREAEVIVSHAVAFATPMAAEVLKRPWIAVALQPSVIFSAYDPPVMPGLAALSRLLTLGPGFWKPALGTIKAIVGMWGGPLNNFRGSLGLPPKRNAVIDDMMSPYGTQAWFSKLLASPQPDWPANLSVKGFAFYDKQTPGSGLGAEIQRFLANGEPPVIFTMGSAAVYDATGFYKATFEALRATGQRAVVLTGADARNQPQTTLPDSVLVADYAPYSELFPLGWATVHQGGIGTTGQALRAGRPMIIVPESHDQPDNAFRVARIGAGRTIPRGRYSAKRLIGELKELRNERYRERANAAARVISEEDGVRAACEGLEQTLIEARRKA